MGVKYILKNIKKQYVFLILITLQIVISFFAMYNSKILNKYLISEQKKIVADLNGGTVFKIQFPEFSNDSFETTLEKVFMDLESLEGLKIFYTAKSDSYIEKFKGSDIFDNNESILENYYLNDIIHINNNTLKKANLKLSDNTLLKQGMFNNTSEDVILGNSFEKIFSVGDILKTDSKELRIVGFLKENQNILTSIEYDNINYDSLDNKILTMDFPTEISNYMKAETNYLWFESPNEVNNIKNIILEKFKKLGLSVNIIDISEYATNKISEYKKNIDLSNITSIIVILVVSTTLIISLLNSIIKRKREFGIYILAGATKNNIFKIIYLEVLFIIMWSFILFLILIPLSSLSLDIKIIFEILILAISYSFIVAAIPLIKIYKSNIKDFIKEV